MMKMSHFEVIDMISGNIEIILFDGNFYKAYRDLFGEIDKTCINMFNQVEQTVRNGVIEYLHPFVKITNGQFNAITGTYIPQNTYSSLNFN